MPNGKLTNLKIDKSNCNRTPLLFKLPPRFCRNTWMAGASSTKETCPSSQQKRQSLKLKTGNSRTAANQRTRPKQRVQSLSEDRARKADTSKRRRRSARDKRTRTRQVARSYGNGQTAKVGQVPPQTFQVNGQPLEQVKLNKRLKGGKLSNILHNKKGWRE